MHIIKVRNVQGALPEMLRHLDLEGVRDESRYGNVIVAPTPVTTVYARPWERVIFWAKRDANPFFHLMEALYLLAGRRDVEWLARYNSRMREFSDDGKTFHGSYGYRWRHHFGFDQLEHVVTLLQRKPRSRRAVIQIWDCEVDLYDDERPDKRDLPCNNLLFVWRDVRDKLCMTVCCRSNDAIWGAAGTNAVQFSILQEYLAAKIGVGIGPLYQISNNLHAYLDIFEKNKPLIDEAADPFRTVSSCPYTRDEVYSQPLVTDAETFDEELKIFIEGVYSYVFENPFFEMAKWISMSYDVWKHSKNYEAAYKYLAQIQDDGEKVLDWKRACIEWLRRRECGVVDLTEKDGARSQVRIKMEEENG